MITGMEGIFVPVVTPFSKGDEAVDLGKLRYNIEKLNETAVRGYMPLGSNGEFFMMTDEECCQVADTVKRSSALEKQVFAGAGRESVKNTAEFIKRVAAMGVDAVFILTPHYFPGQMDQESLICYYEQVANASEAPVILYQAPAYAAGVSLSVDTVAYLSAHPNIIGMKGTGTRTAADYRERIPAGTEFSILSGTFGAFCQNVRDGAAGGVLSCANYIPRLCCDLYRMLESDGEQADALYLKMAELVRKAAAPFGVGGVKMAMDLLGYQGGVTRKPLRCPEERHVREALDLFRKVQLRNVKG